MSVSKESPPVREVAPFKSNKRQSTFRRLNIDFVGTALEQALAEQQKQEGSPHHSPPLPTTLHDSPSLPTSTTPHHSPLPVMARADPAPKRDFNKRANSLERDALPAGLFPGASKKIYDALYLRTRGAIVPRLRVRASRKDLLEWTGIRNLKTIDGHIRYLATAGLIVRHWELGTNEGSEYEIRLPEEVSPPLPTTPHQSPVDTTTQKMGGGDTHNSGSGGEGQLTDNTIALSSSKTFFKTKEEKFDDEAFAGFITEFKNVVRELTGKELEATEKERMRELAAVLIAELRIAASRTSVSSVPAFLAEHLRRRLWKIDQKQAQAEGRELPDQTSAPIPKGHALDCPDCGGSGWWYPNGPDKGVAKCKHAARKSNVDVLPAG